MNGMKDNRVKGQSQLDYLWVNYGPYKVSDTLEENSIPSSALLKEITEEISNESINSLKVINNDLVGINKIGEEVFRLDVSEIATGGRSITEFGKRYLSEAVEDFVEGTPVYYLGFSDGSELLAPIDEYQGHETSSVVVTISQNLIYADVKINNEQSIVPIIKTNSGILADIKICEDFESIQLTKELEGLKARIILDNSNRSLKFKYMTIEDYHSLETKDSTTVYFLKGKKYFYFGEYLIGEGTTNLDNYYTKQEIDENLATKQYVDDLLSDIGFSWKTI